MLQKMAFYSIPNKGFIITLILPAPYQVG